MVQRAPPGGLYGGHEGGYHLAVERTYECTQTGQHSYLPEREVKRSYQGNETGNRHGSGHHEPPEAGEAGIYVAGQGYPLGEAAYHDPKQ